MRPIVTIPKIIQIYRTEFSEEIPDEFVLWLVCQRHAQQLEFCDCYALTDIVGKPEISRKTNLEVLNRKLIKSAVVQTLHPQDDN